MSFSGPVLNFLLSSDQEKKRQKKKEMYEHPQMMNMSPFHPLCDDLMTRKKSHGKKSTVYCPSAIIVRGD